MKTALKEIVSGQHNDAECKEFQEKHERKYGVAPQQCKFQKNPGEIPKLLDKIVIEEDGKHHTEPKPEIPQSFKARFKNFFKRK